MHTAVQAQLTSYSVPDKASSEASRAEAPGLNGRQRTVGFLEMGQRAASRYYRQFRLAVSDISVTETITETEIIDPALTETETMLIYETEIL